MRSRSCALHSDSPQEFLQLAEASLNSTGLFYDEKQQKRGKKPFTHISENLPSERKMGQKQTKIGSKERQNPYADFDFSTEIQVDREEQKELERKNSQKTCKVTLGITCKNPLDTLIHLSLVFGLPPPEIFQTQKKDLELVVASKNNTIYNVWIFSQEAVKSPSPVMQVYLNHCHSLMDADELGDRWNTEQTWIFSNVSQLLI